MKLIRHDEVTIKVKGHKKFTLLNPYAPAFKEQKQLGDARIDVIRWYAKYAADTSVCAVRFLDYY